LTSTLKHVFYFCLTLTISAVFFITTANEVRRCIKSNKINTFAMAPHHWSSGVPNIKRTLKK